jgi:uncharacterized damage-inducible protein DinB
LATSAETQQLVSILDRAYDRRSWHGTNLRGSIRGVAAAQALWRPAPGRHNIHEIVVHAAYWKYAVRRRLEGEARGSFPLKGSNWFVRNGRPDEGAWRTDVELLSQIHHTLRAVVAKLPPAELRKTTRGSTVSNFDLIAGIAAHDLYHAGQIQLLKRLGAAAKGLWR